MLCLSWCSGGVVVTVMLTMLQMVLVLAMFSDVSVGGGCHWWLALVVGSGISVSAHVFVVLVMVVLMF